MFMAVYVHINTTAENEQAEKIDIVIKTSTMMRWRDSIIMYLNPVYNISGIFPPPNLITILAKWQCLAS